MSNQPKQTEFLKLEPILCPRKMLDRIDRLVELMGERFPNQPFSRAMVVREILGHGLEALEQRIESTPSGEMFRPIVEAIPSGRRRKRDQ